jgi:thiamine-phosphate pyrophosphorylase
LSGGRTTLEVIEQVLAGGARAVQLREKLWSKRRLFETALVAREMTSRAGALLIINDHLDVALACGADGVHLGQEDLPCAAARRLAPDLIVGVSTHSLDEAIAAQEAGASYVNIGPLFPTATKRGGHPPIGVEAVGLIGPRLTIPFTVMGGITAENVDLVLAAGAHRIAMVTAVTRAGDIAATVRELRRRIAALRPGDGHSGP